MKKDYELTAENVMIYRELYYKNFKKLAAQDLSEDEIRKNMAPVLKHYGWRYSTFEDFKSIDFMQRLVFEYAHHFNPPLKARPEYQQYDPNCGALRLKDNAQSEDADVLN